MPNPRIEPLKKVLTIDPNDEVAWFGLRKAYMEDANFAEAAQALQQCVAVKPTYSAAYYALAQALHKLGRLDECRTVCAAGRVRKAVVRPASPPGWDVCISYRRLASVCSFRTKHTARRN